MRVREECEGEGGCEGPGRLRVASCRTQWEGGLAGWPKEGQRHLLGQGAEVQEAGASWESFCCDSYTEASALG